MLTTLLIWLYTGALAFIYGFYLIHLLKIVFRDSSGSIPTPPLTILAGLVLITVLTGYLSLTINIGLIAQIIFLCGAVLILAFRRSHFGVYLRDSWASIRNVHPLAWIVFFLMALYALLKTASAPINYDTGLYHAQAIRWIEEYAVIPGLGNIFRNLAYNSAWFLASAFTSFSFLGLQSFHVLAGFLFVIFSFFACFKLSNLIHGKITISGLCAVSGLFFARWLFSLELSSPGTDLPSALLCWSLFLLTLESLEDGSYKALGWKTGLIFVLTGYAITIKLNLLPLVAIPATLFLKNRKSIGAGQLLSVVIVTLTIGFPWAARSVVQSGYLVYPVYQVDIFNPDWKIPAKYVQEDVEWIYSWPRLPGVDKDEVLQMDYQEWVPVWYQNQTRNDRYLLYALAGGLVFLISCILVQIWWKRDFWKEIRRYIPLYLIAWSGVVYWFVQAPVFRYGYAFIGITISMLFAPFGVWFLQRHRLIRFAGTAGIFLFLFAYYLQGIYKMGSPEYLRASAIYPQDYPVVELRRERLGNFEVNMPVQLDQCWYSPLPCTPLHNPEVNLRGRDLSDGFYNKQ